MKKKFWEITNPNKDEHIVALLPYKDKVLVATRTSLYVIKDGSLCEAEFICE